MTIAATVLYEDSVQSGPGGSYPLHDLVLRMVEDEIGGEPWRLRKLVVPNPRNGIGNLVRDLGRTGLIAGAGHLCAVVDRDAIARHLNLASNAPDTKVLDTLRDKSDAPDRSWPLVSPAGLPIKRSAICACEFPPAIGGPGGLLDQVECSGDIGGRDARRAPA